MSPSQRRPAKASDPSDMKDHVSVPQTSANHRISFLSRHAHKLRHLLSNQVIQCDLTLKWVRTWTTATRFLGYKNLHHLSFCFYTLCVQYLLLLLQMFRLQNVHLLSWRLKLDLVLHVDGLVCRRNVDVRSSPHFNGCADLCNPTQSHSPEAASAPFPLPRLVEAILLHKLFTLVYIYIFLYIYSLFRPPSTCSEGNWTL